MRKIILGLILTMCNASAFAKLVIYPALPGNHLQSKVFTVNLASDGKEFLPTFTMQEDRLSEPGRNGNKNFQTMTNTNNWLTFSMDKNVWVEIALANGEAITSCDIRPYRYALKAAIINGKAYFKILEGGKKMYLNINNDVKNPLFLFADVLEINVPDNKATDVLYFGPGVYTIGEKYEIPVGIKTIYIAGGAYVKGSIFAESRSDVSIKGRGILSGEGYIYRSNDSGSDTQGRINYSAVCLNGPGKNQLVEGITFIKCLKFNIVSRGSVTVDNVKCFSFNYTTDGVVSGENSVVKNSFFKVNDDVMKLYSDNQLVHDLVIYHQFNGAPFQFGWGGQASSGSKIYRIDIVKDETTSDREKSGNRALINWRNANNQVQENHYFEDIRSDEPVWKVLGINLKYGSGNSTSSGIFKNIVLKNFSIKGEKDPSYLVVGEGSIALSLENVKVDSKCLTDADIIKIGDVNIKIDCK